MSAIGNPSAAPAGVPVQRPPQPVPVEPKKRRRWPPLLVVLVLATGTLAAYWLHSRSRLLQRGTPVAVTRTAKVSAGTLERVIRLAGQTAAQNFASVTVPIMRGPESRREMTLIELADGGSYVRKGDVVAQIDAQDAQDHIDDVQSTVTQAASDIKKRRAEQLIDWGNLQQTLRIAKADLDQAKLDYSAAEVRTAIDQELLRLYVEEAEARYKQLQADLAFKQAVHKAELRILEITRDRHILHRDRHVGDLKRLTFRASMDGLVVMQTSFRGGELSQIQLGDQVRSGQTFMKIVDTSSMQVEAEANQAESNEVRVEQKATILLDAFPGLKFRGKVHSIAAMGVGGWRENYYIRRIPIRVSIEGSDPRLIPDLSASANVVVESKDNALMVPLEAVQRDGGRDVVFVKQGDRFERREVQLGLRNETHAEVLAGLGAGEEVALERPPAAS